MNKKTTILAGALLLSMALIGAGYAHWIEIITIDGFVQTGELDLDISCELISLEQDKPVAWADCEPMGDEGNSIMMGIFNAYPGLCATYKLRIDNVGTIPAGLEKVMVEGGTDSDYTYLLVPVDTDLPTVAMNLVGTEVPAGSADPEGTCIAAAISAIITPDKTDVPLDPDHPNDLFQIDPGMGVVIDVTVCFGECLPEASTFWWKVEMEYWNWNEITDEFNPMLVYNGEEIDL